MRCAGSIFKNLILAELPAAVREKVPDRVIREGKVPSAYFLEQVGAKGMILGGIQVADYHANLLYNSGGGTAAQVLELVDDLKRRVREFYGLVLEEEVQYLGGVGGNGQK
jgi:UDP-N-acetylmuramate dehydrogenase